MKDQSWRRPPEKPYQPRDPAVTSAMMSKVRSKNSKAELALRRELWHRGYRYRLHYGKLPGRPDLVFVGTRVVVFVDGDFWHGRTLREGGESALRANIRGKRQDWWVAKLTRTVERDLGVSERLHHDGWRVLRLWESEVNENVSAAADKVAAAVDTLSP